MAAAKANKDSADRRKQKYKEDGIALLNSNQGFRDLVFLYWGEGSKYEGNSSFVLPNTDPQMMQYIIKVLSDIGYSDKIVLTSYCYEHSNLDEIKEYWKSLLNKEIRTYVVKNSKDSNQKRIDKQPYGTLRCTVNSTELLNNILGAIEYIKAH